MRRVWDRPNVYMNIFSLKISKNQHKKPQEEVEKSLYLVFK